LVVRVDFGRGYYRGGIRIAALIGTIFTTKQASLNSSINDRSEMLLGPSFARAPRFAVYLLEHATNHAARGARRPLSEP
jgi:hypothetical protein